jgi:hypothetical protein
MKLHVGRKVFGQIYFLALQMKFHPKSKDKNVFPTVIATILGIDCTLKQ